MKESIKDKIVHKICWKGRIWTFIPTIQFELYKDEIFDDSSFELHIVFLKLYITIGYLKLRTYD